MDRHAFHVGDRVQLLVDLTDRYMYNGSVKKYNNYRNAALHSGTTGTIVVSYTNQVGVRWDVKLNARLHNCDGNCPDGYGWYVPVEYIALLSPCIDAGEFLLLLSAHH